MLQFPFHLLPYVLMGFLPHMLFAQTSRPPATTVPATRPQVPPSGPAFAGLPMPYMLWPDLAKAPPQAAPGTAPAHLPDPAVAWMEGRRPGPERWGIRRSDQALVRSRDAGETFQVITQEKWKLTPRGLLAIPNGPIAVIGDVPEPKRTLGLQHQMALSTDQGKTWHTNNIPLDVFGNLSQARDGSLIATGYVFPMSGLAKDDHWITLPATWLSTRDGTNWNPLPNPLGQPPKVIDKIPVTGGTILVLQPPGFLDAANFQTILVRSLREAPQPLATTRKPPRVAVLQDGKTVEVYQRKIEWQMPGPREVDLGEERLIRFNLLTNKPESS